MKKTHRIKDIHKPARNPFLLPWGQYKIETMPGKNCTDAEKATTKDYLDKLIAEIEGTT